MPTPEAHRFFDADEPLMLISHAGDTTTGATAGSIEAYRRAFELGFRAFQVDVVAAPGDSLLSRHAVFGRTWRHGGDTLAERRHRLGPEVATLAELFAEFPDVRWNIEVKSMQCLPALERLIAEHPQPERLCVSAPFHSRLLRRLRARFADIATNASLLEGALIGYNLLPWRPQSANGVQLFAPIARSWIIRRNVRRGLIVHVWTVNDRATAAAVHAAGARGIVTDDFAAVAGALGDPV